MNELIKKVEQWAIDKDLHKASPKAQALKVIEEFTEMLLAHELDVVEEVIDGIGDTYVTLIILSQQQGADFNYIFNKVKKGPQPDFLNYNGPITNYFIYRSINRLVDGVSKNKESDIYSGISRISYILKAMELKYDTTPEQCLSVAYNEIKNRTGKMVNGTFIKSEDLQ